MGGEKGSYFRRDQAISGTDVYSPSIHFPEPSICQRCQAVWKKGKWSLNETLRDEVMRWERAKSVLCPACRRIIDDYPAGIVILKGAYLQTHKEQILQTIQNEEAHSKQKNPLERIMKTEEAKGVLTIATTDPKLARRIGKAVNDSSGGRLEIKFSPGDALVRVYWERD